jgi:hypothetical protein
VWLDVGTVPILPQGQDFVLLYGEPHGDNTCKNIQKSKHCSLTTRSATLRWKPGFQRPSFDVTAINRSKCTEVEAENSMVKTWPW